ncbi:MAG TPA: divalent metal cation transporter [Candidatus Lustribacter sp.]|nr:divalent metal cation transporter [Candidatus Lustribacter sp.]
MIVPIGLPGTLVARPGWMARRRRSLQLFALAAGPGILVMLGENDGPSMLSYAATGAAYGVGFFVPFILLTFAMAYVVQEMIVRVGIATGRGHADLIRHRFGPRWSALTTLDLAVGNLLTLVTEFIAVRAGAAYFGVPPAVAVGSALALVVLANVLRRYVTWERAVLVLALGNLVFVPAALNAQLDPAALGNALWSWGPLPGGVSTAFLTLILANVGATVTPWMLFFQQSAVVDKGLTAADLGKARLDTGVGAALAAAAGIAALATAAVLFTHHVDASSFSTGADFATALRPFIGVHGAALFALGMIEAGMVAALTISASSGYTVGEVAASPGAGRTRNRPAFAATAIASAVFAAATVLIPNAPLLAISIGVNVIAALLMAPALVFALLLANDGALMGRLRNNRAANIASGAVVVTIAALGGLYAVLLILPKH